MGEAQRQATPDEPAPSSSAEGDRATPTGAQLQPGEAFRIARALLDAAEQDRAAILADAERRAQLREREAELLVAKARRLLEAAEQKAAVIVAAARSAEDVLDITDATLGRVVAPSATVLPRGSLAARIDEIVASAVAHAVDEALPTPGTLGAAS
jgi:hypothetical protein